jgi:hypothetical protein
LDEEDSNARYMLKRDMQVSDQIFIKDDVLVPGFICD